MSSSNVRNFPPRLGAYVWRSDVRLAVPAKLVTHHVKRPPSLKWVSPVRGCK